jgi:hypothetical protein
MSSEKKPEWIQFSTFALKMQYAMQGSQGTRELVAKIPTYAVRCLKCTKLHLFSELLKGCPNCSNTSYAVGGIPSKINIICSRCGKEILKTVNCQCGCENDLTAQTLLQPKTGCFIATAACGDPLASEVIVLTSFRDMFLGRSRTGRIFIRFYYAISPPIATVIARVSLLRRVTLILVVRPLAGVVRSFWNP